MVGSLFALVVVEILADEMIDRSWNKSVVLPLVAGHVPWNISVVRLLVAGLFVGVVVGSWRMFLDRRRLCCVVRGPSPERFQELALYGLRLT